MTTVPFPSDEQVNLQRPDAAEVEVLARGVVGAVAPGGTLTELQAVLLRALFHSMTDHDVDVRAVDPLAPEDLAEALRDRNEIFRTRILQVMLLGALILVPLPDDVTQRVRRFALAAGVDDGMLRVAQGYTRGSLGLALIDFERNGYTSNWDEHADERSSVLHTSAALDTAWAQCVNDAELAARWQGLAGQPPGTLGHEVHRFYRSRGFAFPGEVGSAPPYLAQHDFVHIVADYGTTVESEIEVFGLIARAIPDPRGFSLLAMVIGLFETGYLASGAGAFFQMDRGHLDARVAVRLADAMRRGAWCGRDLLGLDWFAYADWPVEEVRRELDLRPKSEAAVAAGSVAPWDRQGISPFQLASGRALAEREGRRYEFEALFGG